MATPISPASSSPTDTAAGADLRPDEIQQFQEAITAAEEADPGNPLNAALGGYLDALASGDPAAIEEAMAQLAQLGIGDPDAFLAAMYGGGGGAAPAEGGGGGGGGEAAPAEGGGGGGGEAAPAEGGGGGGGEAAPAEGGGGGGGGEAAPAEGGGGGGGEAAPAEGGGGGEAAPAEGGGGGGGEAAPAEGGGGEDGMSLVMQMLQGYVDAMASGDAAAAEEMATLLEEIGVSDPDALAMALEIQPGGGGGAAASAAPPTEIAA